MVNASEDAENNGMVNCKYSCLKSASQGFRRLAHWLAETWRLNIGLLSPTSNNSKLPLCLFKCLCAQAYKYPKVNIHSCVRMTPGQSNQ